MTYKVYDINYYAGRMGDLSGTYLIKEGALEQYNGRYFYASDVLGKHSEVSFTWPKSDRLSIKESHLFSDVDFSSVFEKTQSDIIHMGGFDFVEILDEAEMSDD